MKGKKAKANRFSEDLECVFPEQQSIEGHVKDVLFFHYFTVRSALCAALQPETQQAAINHV